MKREAPTVADVRVRDLRASDLDAVIRIDALHSGEHKPGYWRSLLRDFLDEDRERVRVALVAEAEHDREMVGYLLGEVRAFEFGSEPCGWVITAGVEPGRLRRQTGSRLLAEICRRFREHGVRRVRTMVLRNNVPVLSFFRANGFVGGSFVQLELDLEERP
jgi:ribosomal protein S18 acetylase RimI-like enzyme